MEHIEKSKIVEALQKHIEKHSSQNKAAKSLGISSATITNISQNKWERISDEMWRKVAAKLNQNKSNEGWIIAETPSFKKFKAILNDAKVNANCYAITNPAGSSKTTVFKDFAANNKNAFYVGCNEFWNKKAFLSEMLKALGADPSGNTIYDLMENIIRIILSLEDPIFIWDEFDKMSDQNLLFYISLFNMMEGKCALIIAATDHLESRIRKGLSRNKKGYNEIYSRIGRNFINVGLPTLEDIATICTVNGVEDHNLIKKIYNQSENDLRRVKRLIHKHKNGGQI